MLKISLFFSMIIATIISISCWQSRLQSVCFTVRFDSPIRHTLYFQICHTKKRLRTITNRQQRGPRCTQKNAYVRVRSLLFSDWKRSWQKRGPRDPFLKAWPRQVRNYPLFDGRVCWNSPSHRKVSSTHSKTLKSDRSRGWVTWICFRRVCYKRHAFIFLSRFRN